MRIDIKDLPANMQKQVLRKIAEEDNRHALQLESHTEETQKNKYNARKVTLQMPDGTEHEFDSIHEAEMYKELRIMERSGEISDLRIQVPFLLIEKQKAPSGKTYRECKYIADFAYQDKDGNTVVADAKGMKTDVYKLKKKLMLKVWGIEIKEI